MTRYKHPKLWLLFMFLRKPRLWALRESLKHSGGTGGRDWIYACDLYYAKVLRPW